MLYKNREKWWLAFSKNYFSGGVLSSQRSETTTNSLSRRLRMTASLCHFHNIFCVVVLEWRKNENGEDNRNSNGIPEIAFPSMDLLKHDLFVYTIEAYNIFEQEFIDGAFCNYEEVQEKYIRKRWCKTIEECQSNELRVRHASKEDIQCSSIWKMQMIRKMNTLITVSEMNTQARADCEEYFNKLKELVEQEAGSIYVEENVASKQMDSSRKILNPVGSKPKAERNKRKKSIV
ncbi:hypothetical protein Cgig2_013392 [Carnegiea gigantea]|uniref:Protein FAR1-RELATED SEQUENCE n=1 Tax=Carnegiea gigantea TaxID=171969 RepID=A0A9Q1QE27_9CARY|nr:hypothetical protein Cgig2_013392 [Carnegiea gigantea]